MAKRRIEWQKMTSARGGRGGLRGARAETCEWEKIVQRLLGEESADYGDNKRKHKPASVVDDQMNNRAATDTA